MFQPEEEYLDAAAGDPTTASDEEQQEMDDFVAALRALGLVEGEVDLAAAFGDLASEGTLAYYDPATEVVYVRGDELTPSVRVTVAHELTHVLQDQHFDLERLADPDYERYDGLRAMAEGDAGRIEDAYTAEVLTTAEQADAEADSMPAPTTARRPWRASRPCCRSSSAPRTRWARASSCTARRPPAASRGTPCWRTRRPPRSSSTRRRGGPGDRRWATSRSRPPTAPR